MSETKNAIALLKQASLGKLLKEKLGSGLTKSITAQLPPVLSQKNDYEEDMTVAKLDTLSGNIIRQLQGVNIYNAQIILNHVKEIIAKGHVIDVRSNYYITMLREEDIKEEEDKGKLPKQPKEPETPVKENPVTPLPGGKITKP